MKRNELSIPESWSVVGSGMEELSSYLSCAKGSLETNWRITGRNDWKLFVGRESKAAKSSECVKEG